MPAKNQTASDGIKQFLAIRTNTKENDWRRVSRKKGDVPDSIIREFENAAAGLHMIVTDYQASGRLVIEPLTAQAPANEFLSVIETNAAKNAAADELIAAFMIDRLEDMRSQDDEAGEEQAELRQKAGRALANRFCFALAEDEGRVQWYITPLAFWQKEGCCHDDHIGFIIRHLLPHTHDEVQESCFEIEKPKGLLAQVHELLERGFIWDKGFQDYINRVTPEFSPTAQSLLMNLEIARWAPSPFLPVSETDADKNHAAGIYIEAYCRGEITSQRNDEFEAVAETAGVALNNRFMVMLDTAEEQPVWIFAPIEYLMDGNIDISRDTPGLKMPAEAYSSSEGCFEFRGTDLAQQIQACFAAGYTWLRPAQDMMDQRMGTDNSAFSAMVETEQKKAKAPPKADGSAPETPTP